MTVDNVDDLVMRMAVQRSHPAFLHFSFGEEELFVVRQDTPLQTRFRHTYLSFFVFYDHLIRNCRQTFPRLVHFWHTFCFDAARRSYDFYKLPREAANQIGISIL